MLNGWREGLSMSQEGRNIGQRDLVWLRRDHIFEV